MKRIFLFFTLAFICQLHLNAGIVCPPDKNLYCNDDIYNLEVTGQPTLINTYGQARYIDLNLTNSCRSGEVQRTWYVDKNNNKQRDPDEELCVQHIYVSYIDRPIVITWPDDLTLSCVDDIPVNQPQWVSGPCDVIGITYEDQVLETGDDACFKIMRKFKLINWCSGSSTINPDQWSHTQVIKIIDNTKPVMPKCEFLTLPTSQNCKATFSIENTATDISACSEDGLFWTVEIDLWSDGDIDYKYSYDASDPRFLLKDYKSGDTVRITLPVEVGRGWHKVTWRVRDRCANYTVCTQDVMVVDGKKPTPYMLKIISAAFRADYDILEVPARMFNLDSYDNCSDSEYLKYSFSPDVNDTLRTIDCTNVGFQFYTIYVTDLEGNQDYAEVFMLVYDNGSCSTSGLQGSLTEAGRKPISSASISLISESYSPDNSPVFTDEEGQFAWQNISLYDDMKIRLDYNNEFSERVNVVDLKLLQDYIFGKVHLEDYQLVAADVNQDGKINAKDLPGLRDIILDENDYEDRHWSFFTEDTADNGLVNLNQIRYFSSPISLEETLGNLDFKAVYKGDISGAINPDTESRSVVNYSKNEDGNKTSFYLTEDKDIFGFQLEIAKKNLSIHDISSPYFDILTENIHETDYGIKIISTEVFSFNSELPFIVISPTYNDTDDVELMATSLVLTEPYKASKLIERETNSSEPLSIYPNPVNDVFILQPEGAKVISISNASGISVPFSQKDNTVSWSVESGIYFARILAYNRVLTAKIIRSR